MPVFPPLLNRRSFLSGSAALGMAAATPSLAAIAQQAASAPAAATAPQQPAPAVPPAHKSMPRTAPPYDKNTIDIIGPRPGFTPHIGTFVTMLTWMEFAVLGPTRDLTQPQLDFLLDGKANTIGALMLHLAATEVLYQRITFGNENFEKLPPDYEAKWGPAMNLGDAGRASIKGHDLVFYQDALREARETTLAEFAKRDDAWFLAPHKDAGFTGGPANYFCYWFHVCEHISHHAGQIDLILKRLPGAQPSATAG